MQDILNWHIFNNLGIKAQETILGTFMLNGVEKVVCACKDFTSESKTFYDFCSIKNTVIDSGHNGTGTEISEILDTIEKQQYVNPQELTECFWNVFVVDAFLGNFDRHNGNWGFLFDNITQTAAISPVFDCGSCLLPQADDRIMKLVINDKAELNARIFNFPLSVVKLNGQKINYYDFLNHAQYRDCNKALIRLAPRINIDEICDFIYSVPYISDLQKEFYQRYIKARYEKIILPVFENVLDLQHTNKQEEYIDFNEEIDFGMKME